MPIGDWNDGRIAWVLRDGMFQVVGVTANRFSRS